MKSKLVIDQEKRNVQTSGLLHHLDVFNDAVIAIILTIMAIEVPVPGEHGETYLTFIHAVILFLITFFITAGFWYEHHNSLSLIKAPRKRVIVLNFVFLALLTLLPVLTKWMILEPHSLAITHYGAVFFLITIMQTVFQLIADSEYYEDDFDKVKIARRQTRIKSAALLTMTAVLIGVSVIFPTVAGVLYILIPILIFFWPTNVH